MTKEQVIELAKQAGFHQEPKSSLIADKPEDRWFHCKQADIERFATLVRNAALEEAIKACWVEATAAEHDANSQAEYGADCCACAIRNLKEPTP